MPDVTLAITCAVCCTGTGIVALGAGLVMRARSGGFWMMRREPARRELCGPAVIYMYSERVERVVLALPRGPG